MFPACMQVALAILVKYLARLSNQVQVPCRPWMRPTAGSRHNPHHDFRDGFQQQIANELAGRFVSQSLLLLSRVAP